MSFQPTRREVSLLADSGDRTDQAGTGALRDRPANKGRCDLLPLMTVASFLKVDEEYCQVFQCITDYIYKGNPDKLIKAAQVFSEKVWETPYDAVIEASKHYEDGAKKYTDRNWEKGLPLSSFIDSGVRHLIKHIQGLDDEPHDRACLWNLFGAHWTHFNRHELIDMPFQKES